MTAEEVLNDAKPPEDHSSDLIPGSTLEKTPTQHNHDAPPKKKNLPQIIAHRGYKALYPENSMLAIEEAIKAGAHAIETDVHESKDGVVVLSHDPTLKRCFSLPAKISSCTWPYLSTLLTTSPPHVPLARLSDLLSYLSATPSLSHIWILLDIKTDDDPSLTLVPAIARTIASHPPPPDASWTWQDRIVLGGWNENYLTSLGKELQGFKRAYIGFSLLYANRFVDDEKWPGVGFNLLQQSLVGPVGRGFLERVREGGKTERKVWVWTVNEEGWMRWCVGKGVDGGVTDDVGLLREVLDEEQHCGGGKGKKKVTVGMYIKAAMVQILTVVLAVVIWGRLRKVGRVVEGEVKKKHEEKADTREQC
ncbi:PLC-like phosphodiesterase [Triangularia setosa]|uniref:PLC-like phosphodiesterase n=1 Tax=Triangularia setosa TaxID=2587417 RepID=A0AAN7A311_9PEZI|nr:PLC-like phosphodiesterase [Podospora setosa]